MKKTITILLTLSLALGLSACANNDNAASPSATTTPSATVAATPSASASSTAAATGETKTTAKSDPDENGSHAEMTITWDGDTIKAVDWKEYSDGVLKDENYGKEAGDDNFKKAQVAVDASKKYATELVEKQDIDKVDTISGATNSHKLFKQLFEECKKQK